MTSAEMLARCRTLLDEVTPNFWTNDEIYAGLTDGQKQVTTYFLTSFQKLQEKDRTAKIPTPIRPLITTLDDSIISGSSKSLPSDFLYDIDVNYGATSVTKNPAFKREYSAASHLKDNTYLSNEYFYSISSSNIIFEYLPTGDHYYTLVYIKTPTAIDASTQPILPSITHTSIVHWAVSQMLFKDQRPEEAKLYLENFLIELQMIG